MAPSVSPSLLALPIDIRLCIYDLLFRPLLDIPNKLQAYVLPSELPHIDLIVYATLTLISKQLKDEAIDHFNKHFLPKLTLHFDSTSRLHAFAQHVTGLALGYQRPRFALYSCPTRYYDLDFASGHSLQYADTLLQFGVEQFTLRQSKTAYARLAALAGFCSSNPRIYDNHLTLSGLGRDVYTHQTRNGKSVDVLRVSAVEDALSITTVQICRDEKSTYVVMTGLVTDLDWTDFDAGRARENDLRFRSHCDRYTFRGYNYVEGSADMGLLFGEEARTVPVKRKQRCDRKVRLQ